MHRQELYQLGQAEKGDWRINSHCCHTRRLQPVSWIFVSLADCALLTAVRCYFRRTDAHLIIANLGDCRAVLCRGRTAVPLSEDHKPNRPGQFLLSHIFRKHFSTSLSSSPCCGTTWQKHVNLTWRFCQCSIDEEKRIKGCGGRVVNVSFSVAIC